MRVACIALHYGKEYLAWTVRGVQDAVDQVHIFYTSTPSYGHAVEGAVCPDSEAELKEQANRFLKKPLFWHNVQAGNEGQHRDMMMHAVRQAGAELYLVADSDEIWDPAAACVTMDAVYNANRAGRWLARFANFWHSHEWMVHDSFRPIRVVDLRHSLDVDAYLTEEQQPEPVFHFGYAQAIETMRYKITCHGHQDVRMPWARWLEEKYIGWKPGDADTHPCVNNLWTPTPTDPKTLAKVKELLHDHPRIMP